MSHLGIIQGEIELGQRDNDQQHSQTGDKRRSARQPVTADSAIREGGKNRRSVIVGAGSIGLIGLAGCLGGENDESAIRSVLQQQAEALENENLDSYMETMHPESPLFDNTREATGQLLERFDLEVDLEINSVTVEEDTATAEAIQVTRTAEPNPDFRDNRIEMTHELRTYEGEWRVYDTTLNSTEYL